MYLLEEETKIKEYELCIISSEVFTELLQFSQENLLIALKEIAKIFSNITY